MKNILLLFVFFSTSLSIGHAQQVGSAAPDFTFTANNGITYKLSDLRGKVVYLFFFGSTCSTCRQNGPSTQTNIVDPIQNDSRFIALGIDTWNGSLSAVQTFAGQTGIKYPLLLNGSSVLTSYATTYDRSLVVDAQGILRYKGTTNVANDQTTVKNTINTHLATATSNENAPSRPEKAQLLQNYPNPFNPQTTIPFFLNRSGFVSISIFDMLGEKIASLENRNFAPGTHSAVWNAAAGNGINISSGIYFYQLSVDGVTIDRRKMSLMK